MLDIDGAKMEIRVSPFSLILEFSKEGKCILSI